MKICPQCECGYPDSQTTCPVHGGMLSEIRDLRPGMLIRGAYRIVEKLGKGGMGTVYLARQTLLNEPRALKFLAPDLSEDEEFTRRFLREVRTLRKVRNRHVVDCGDPERAEDGSLFFSMEYVDGPSLGAFLKTAPRPFDVAQALEITRGIAEGLGAAHAKGMVHRDIKPDNILLAREGNHWVPKIADFGIVATKDSGHHTRTGNMLLTMAFAAPEQWNGTRAADLDGRTDLYALGGLLFDMLTGRPVFDAENYHEWAQSHLHALPPAPSSLRPELAQWKGLDEFVLRLLAKDRNHRPQNVPELLNLIDGLVYEPAIPGANHAAAAQPPAANADYENPQGSLPLSTDPYQTQVPAANTSGSYQTAASKASKAAARKYLFSSDTDPVAKNSGANSGWFWLLLIVAVAGLGFAAQRFYAPRAKFVALLSQSQPILSVAFSANSEILASASHDNTIQLWNTATGKALNALPDHVDALAFSPSGNTLATAEWDGTLKQWDMTNAQVLSTLDAHAGKVNCVAFSPDSRLLASGGSDKNIRIWDLAAEKLVRSLPGHRADITSVVFSPNGGTLASASTDATIKLWDTASGALQRTLRGHRRPVNAIAISPDGRTLASASDDATIKLWDLSTGNLTRTLTGHTGPIRSVAFSPNGRTLASGGDDATVKLWRISGATAAYATLQGQAAAINSVAFSHDGNLLASGSADNSVRLWYMGTIRN